MLNGVLVVLLGVIALLAIPLTLTFRIATRQVFDNDIRLRWAFGLVRMRIPAGKTEAPSTETGEAKRKPTRRKLTSRRKSKVFGAVRQKGFRRRIIRFVGDLWRAVHKQDVRLRVRVGLGDPADTGQLWAVLGPVSGLLASVRDASISIEPEFVDATIELDSSGSIRVIPLQLVYLTVGLLLSSQVWKGLRR